MSENNGFFHVGDERLEKVGGMDLLPSWWSRPYEYAWAKQFIVPGQVVADMGCGWSGRPFKEELADNGCEVYAIDGDPRVLELPRHDRVNLVVRRFLEPMDDLPQFDAIFCLSVLEDLSKDLLGVLEAFRGKLKPGGSLIVTFDSPYDSSKETPVYPGLDPFSFLIAAGRAGFKICGDVNLSKKDLVHHSEWNLCVSHWVLCEDAGLG